MEEFQSSPQGKRISNEGDTNSDEFYEKIEAPKYVDFTLPDLERYRPDDRYWFCSRVGCDLKHEEELNPETIYKNFVLRVMAARSDNVRLTKTLNQKCSRENVKCPQSAPAKSYKTRRLSKLAVISSLSHRLNDLKLEVKPIPKPISTPKARVKQVASKFMTTPRNKMCITNPNSFRSVQNPKAKTIDVLKERGIAKAIDFKSPKKEAKTKKITEVNTPVKKSEGMKRREMISQSKRILGYSVKSLKGLRRDSTKRLSSRKMKTQTKNLVHSHKDSKEKSVRRTKEERKKENESSDMEIDVRSRNGFLKVKSLPGSSSEDNGENEHEEGLAAEKILENLGSTGSAEEKFQSIIAEKNPMEVKSLSDSSEISGNNGDEECLATEKILENSGSINSAKEKFILTHAENNPMAKSFIQVQILNEDENGSTEKHNLDRDEKINPSSKEIMDSDDKENASVSDDNRKLLGKNKTSTTNQKNAQTADNKTSKKGLTSTAKGVQVVKYEKAKPTNPKPFRLRTNERGILKEENMEKKPHLHVPSNETTNALKFPVAKSQKMHDNDNHQEIPKPHTTVNRKEVEIKMRCIKRTVLTNQKATDSSSLQGDKVNVVGKSENSSRKSKSLARPQRDNSIKETKKPSKLCLIDGKTASKLPNLKQTENPAKAASSYIAPSTSLSRGRKPTTVSKEPNFHGIHRTKKEQDQVIRKHTVK